MNNAVTIPVSEDSLQPPSQSRNQLFAWVAVGVAALGYFIDVADMFLFSNFRVASLQSLGLNAKQITETGAYLINCQQVGLLLGGILWGVMGDKRGRVKVMFGSIFLYSTASVLNSFVTTIPVYALLRFVTGIGLAGEIGAGICLVSELLPKERRGYATTIVATVGVAGALGAALMGKYMVWRHAFLLGGIMGFALLLLRMLVQESGLYNQLSKEKSVRRGSLKMLFGSADRVIRFACCVLLGFPVYLIFGMLSIFAPEIALSLGIKGVTVPDTMLYASAAMSLGDLVSGNLSQIFKSRKLVLGLFLGVAMAAITSIPVLGLHTANQYYFTIAVASFGVGYWAVLVTTVAEQFGTNLRATATTFAPNLIRSVAIPFNLIFVAFHTATAPITVVLWIAVPVFALSFIALWRLKETYGRELNFVEM